MYDVICPWARRAPVALPRAVVPRLTRVARAGSRPAPPWSATRACTAPSTWTTSSTTRSSTWVPRPGTGRPSPAAADANLPFLCRRRSSKAWRARRWRGRWSTSRWKRWKTQRTMTPSLMWPRCTSSRHPDEVLVPMKPWALIVELLTFPHRWPKSTFGSYYLYIKLNFRTYSHLNLLQDLILLMMEHSRKIISFEY